MARGLFTTTEQVRNYIQGGKGKLTVRSLKTRKRFTFQFKKPKERSKGDTPIFVRLLAGPDNERSYSYLGCLWPISEGHTRLRYAHGWKSRVAPNSGAAIAMRWLIKHVYEENLSPLARIHHEGTCGKCGKTLTVPQSIERGIGPTCWESMKG